MQNNYFTGHYNLEGIPGNTTERSLGYVYALLQPPAFLFGLDHMAAIMVILAASLHHCKIPLAAL